MNFRDRPVAIWAFPLAMLVAALLLLGSDAGTFATKLRGILFDAYQHAAPRAYQDTRGKSGFAVRVLNPDESSLAHFGPCPWPHAVLARLTDEMKAAGAAVVVFAFPLDEPDPVSPKSLIAEVPTGPSFDPV